MDEPEPLVIPATTGQEAVLRWISSSGPGRRVGAGIGRTVAALNRRRLGAVLEDEPWTPLRRPVASATVALVATGGVHLRRDPPFDPHGDGGFRAIPGTAEPGDLQITHQAYDRRDARADLNLVFPLQRLRELEAEGVVGRVAGEHYGFGLAPHPAPLLVSAREVAGRLIRAQVDLALLVPA
jgi:D-proline reductase (dithiol) PrdB